MIDEQRAIRRELGQSARRLLEGRTPIEVSSSLADSDEFDRELWVEVASLGWIEACVDPSNAIASSILYEECGRCLYPGPLFSTAALAGPLLEGDLRQSVIDGSTLVTVAWYEPTGMTSLDDPSCLTTRAVHGSTGWRLTGTKTRVLEADRSDDILVVADSFDGPSLFIIQPDSTCLTRSLGLDPSRREFHLRLDDHPARMVGDASRVAIDLGLTARLAGLATTYEALGAAGRVLEEVVAHASTRQQFGRPIGAFQAVAGPIADSYVDIELARALAGWAAIAVALGDKDADLAVAAASSSAVTAAISTCERAIQVAGAMGFSWEYLIHRYLRRSLWLRAYHGAEAQGLRRISQALIDDQLLPRTVEFLDDERAASFREETRNWISSNIPTPARGLELVSSMDEFDNARAEWREKVLQTGNLTAHWPTNHGGKGTSDVITAIFREEVIKAHPRVSHGDCGVDLVAPLLMRYGTSEQLARFLEPIRQEDEIWTQGFSEPDAGSDLASLATRALPDGDDWIINGTKTWSTYAPYADWIFLLARTDPTAQRHRGISCFLVDARSPGVEIRPIRDITGGVEFAEIFFTNVRVPGECLLGEVNGGWSVAVMTLAHERVIESYEDIGELGFVIDRLMDGLRERLRSSENAGLEAGIREQFADIWARYQAVRLVQYACVIALEGSDAPPTESEIVKLVWSEVAQEAAALGLRLFGLDASRSDAEFWRWNYFNARSLTIYAGTSEIIRSVVAERVLGLPRSR